MSLIVDDHQYGLKEVERVVWQVLPVFPILLVIFLSGIIEEVEEEMERSVATSFTDDRQWLVTADSVVFPCERLEKAEVKMVKQRDWN